MSGSAFSDSQGLQGTVSGPAPTNTRRYNHSDCAYLITVYTLMNITSVESH